MTILTLIIGLLLILLGIGGYIGTDFRSLTALIPAAIGLPLLNAGIIAQKETLRKHAMHAAAALSFIGFVGASRGVGPFIRILMGDEVARPTAVYTQAIMFALCGILLFASIRSFIAARSVSVQEEA